MRDTLQCSPCRQLAQLLSFEALNSTFKSQKLPNSDEAAQSMLHPSDNKHHSSLQLQCGHWLVLPQSSSGKIFVLQFAAMEMCQKELCPIRTGSNSVGCVKAPGTAKRALRIQFAVPVGATRLLQIQMCSHYAASRHLSSQRFRLLGSLSTPEKVNFHSAFLVRSAHSCHATPALLGLAP